MFLSFLEVFVCISFCGLFFNNIEISLCMQTSTFRDHSPTAKRKVGDWPAQSQCWWPKGRPLKPTQGHPIGQGQCVHRWHYVPARWIIKTSGKNRRAGALDNSLTGWRSTTFWSLDSTPAARTKWRGHFWKGGHFESLWRHICSQLRYKLTCNNLFGDAKFYRISSPKITLPGEVMRYTETLRKRE